MSHYQELLSLTLQGIKSKVLASAAGFISSSHPAYLDLEPIRNIDLELLTEAKNTDDSLPLLCLRCRISHPLEAWLKATFHAHHENHNIELKAMASYALDDHGALLLDPARKARKISPIQ